MADNIKAGDIIGNFRVTSVTPLYEQNETAVMLSHGPTGLQWLHFIADGASTPTPHERRSTAPRAQPQSLSPSGCLWLASAMASSDAWT